MSNLFPIVNRAVADLENYIPDMAEAAESEKETKALRALMNRLAILVNETRSQLP